MSLFSFKMLSAMVIFCAAFFVGLFPARMLKKHSCRIHIYEAFASGIFLGAGLFHMLPDAQDNFVALELTRFPYAIFAATTTFIALFVIERVSLYFSEHSERHLILAYLVTFSLSIHSIIAGGALGITNTLASAAIILIAILAHKSCASFAMVMRLRQSEVPDKQLIALLFLFSMMTPIGILLSTSISQALSHDTGQLSEAIINAITAGTFLYIGTLDTLGRQLKPQRLINRLQEFVSLVAGMFAMGVVATWI